MDGRVKPGHDGVFFLYSIAGTGGMDSGFAPYASGATRFFERAMARPE